MTTKDLNQYIKIEVNSLVIQNYFNFENYSFVVHFTLDQTGVLFWVTRYIYTYIHIYRESENSKVKAFPSHPK